MKRRKFIHKSLAASSIAMIPQIGYDIQSQKSHRITHLTKPVAIAMWDFSWLLRHHRIGSFEDWDKVLDGLAERGYNAIRMDCFPHLVASDSDGKIIQEYYHPRSSWGKPVLWGNQYSMYSRPREALLEFLPKCRERGIHVGLATWFLGHGTERNKQVTGLNGFVRVWDELLWLLNEHDLLYDILYVDLLNEYPLWHGFEWLTNELNQMSDMKAFRKTNPDANIPEVDFVNTGEKKYNPVQEKFYKSFMTDAIKRLKIKWPDIDFFASLSHASNVPWEDNDFSEFSCLDAHIWFSHNSDFSNTTNYSRAIHAPENDMAFEQANNDIKAYWQQHKTKLISWMDDELKQRADVSKKYNMICGNTEGWGTVMWYEHPALDWTFMKTAGDICVDLSIKHGFKFICTSNFTHPHFPGIWDDIKWHKQVTERIKHG
jgi:hypothetical protein